MPEVSRFYGITIYINFREHPPAHFHAEYSGDEALIDIEALSVMEGRLPRRIRAMVIRWATLHQDELRVCWQHAQNREPVGKIDPLP